VSEIKSSFGGIQVKTMANASAVLVKALNNLSFLQSSLIVTGESDRFIIDVTQRGEFLVGTHMMFARDAVNKVLEYIGEIKQIITLNHDTDEEEVIVF